MGAATKGTDTLYTPKGLRRIVTVAVAAFANFRYGNNDDEKPSKS
jgi:hypothetical protein